MGGVGGTRAARAERAARLLLGTAQPVLWGSLLLTSPSHRFLPLRQAVHARAPRLGAFGSATLLLLLVATMLGCCCCCCCCWMSRTSASDIFRRLAGGYSVDGLGDAIAVVVVVVQAKAGEAEAERRAGCEAWGVRRRGRHLDRYPTLRLRQLSSLSSAVCPLSRRSRAGHSRSAGQPVSRSAPKNRELASRIQSSSSTLTPAARLNPIPSSASSASASSAIPS